MRFCIFYGDGSTFEGVDDRACEAPVYDVVAVVQDATKPCQLLHQVDFYWWRPDWGRFVGGDIFGFLYDAAHVGASWVKQGRTIKPEDYREIMGRAVELKQKWDAGS